MDLPSREALIDALEAVAEGQESPTTIVATHHLEEVAPSTTHAALLKERQLVASGEVEQVLTPQALEACFGIPVDVGRRGGRWSATAEHRRAAPTT